MGSDTVKGVGGDDIVIGDSGQALFDPTGILLFITSIAPAFGGDDVLDVGDGDNIVIGGVGDDTITSLAGEDIVFGDNGNATFTVVAGQRVLTRITTSDPFVVGASDHDDTVNVGAGDNIVFAGNGKDLVDSEGGDDIIVGDNGMATFTTSAVLVLLSTIDPGYGDADILRVGEGNNIAFGGISDDRISSLTGNDMLLGDNGFASFTDAGVMIRFSTSDAPFGGNDYIHASSGDNLVLAGSGNDTVVALGGNDAVLGDNGFATYREDTGSIIQLATSNSPYAGDDDIDVGEGNNIVMAGTGKDRVVGGVNNTTAPAVPAAPEDRAAAPAPGAAPAVPLVGSNFVAGDNASTLFDANGNVIVFISTASGAGDVDFITVNLSAYNYVIGGTAGDVIIVGDGHNVILGDEGRMTLDKGALLVAETLFSGVGGDDHIDLGNGLNYVIAGSYNDDVNVGVGFNVVFGDEARMNFFYNVLGTASSLNPNVAGNDLIVVGIGINTVVGGTGRDRAYVGSGENVIFGDNAYISWTGGRHVRVANSLFYGIGNNDYLVSYGGDSLIVGGAHSDSIHDAWGNSFITGDNAMVVMRGGRVLKLTTVALNTGSADEIQAGAGHDHVFGGNGDDFINGGSGADVLVGDHASYSSGRGTPGDVLLIQEGIGGHDTIMGGSGMDLLLGGGGDDWLDSGSGNDSIFAGYGDDYLYGGRGNDVLVGGPGADFLDGGPGADELYVDILDTWVADYADTIIGGPFWSTGFAVLPDGDFAHLGSADSALERLLAAFAKLRADAAVTDGLENEASSDAAYLTESMIVGADAQTDLVRHFDMIFWGGSGYGFWVLCLGDFLTACNSCDWYVLPEALPSVSRAVP